MSPPENYAVSVTNGCFSICSVSHPTTDTFFSLYLIPAATFLSVSFFLFAFLTCVSVSL